MSEAISPRKVNAHIGNNGKILLHRKRWGEYISRDVLNALGLFFLVNIQVTSDNRKLIIMREGTYNVRADIATSTGNQNRFHEKLLSDYRYALIDCSA